MIPIIPKSYNFNSIYISQNKNIVSSRLDIDITSEIIKGIKIKIPLIGANMSTVCNANFCIELYKNGSLGVLHRADTDENIIKETKKISKNCKLVAVSIGIGDGQKKLLNKLINADANIIFVDVAHGFGDYSIEMCRYIKEKYPHVKVVIGNTTNIDIVKDVYKFVDAIKVGIANGLACDTKYTAGCNEGQFSTVLKFKDVYKKYGIPIQSDGGVRIPADFVKAIGAGANSIMAGSILARCPESAAPLEMEQGIAKKVYAGMASKYVQEMWRGGLKEGTCAEGKKILLDMGEPVKNLLERYAGALRSGITYGGGRDIESFQKNVKFVEVI